MLSLIAGSCGAGKTTFVDASGNVPIFWRSKEYKLFKTKSLLIDLELSANSRMLGLKNIVFTRADLTDKYLADALSYYKDKGKYLKIIRWIEHANVRQNNDLCIEEIKVFITLIYFLEVGIHKENFNVINLDNLNVILECIKLIAFVENDLCFNNVGGIIKLDPNKSSWGKDTISTENELRHFIKVCGKLAADYNKFINLITHTNQIEKKLKDGSLTYMNIINGATKNTEIIKQGVDNIFYLKRINNKYVLYTKPNDKTEIKTRLPISFDNDIEKPYLINQYSISLKKDAENTWCHIFYCWSNAINSFKYNYKDYNDKIENLLKASNGTDDDSSNQNTHENKNTLQ
jgi:hypothetical protein